MLSSVFHKGRLLTVAVATSLVVLAGWAPGASAADPSSAPSSAPPAVSGDMVITPEQAALVNEKLGFITEKGLWGEFALKKNGTLTTAHSLAEIQGTFSLSDDQVATMKGILDFDAHAKNARVPKDSGGVSPMVFMSGTVIYFSYSEVGGLLLTAATAGPIALGAAITGIGMLIGGPIGAAIAFALSVMGAASLVNLAYLILQSAVLHRGVYFGVEFNPFPNYTQGLWCGCN